MLVLTRKLQERIKIGDDVTITVLRVKGNAVRIGIEAPRSVRVMRAELPGDGGAPAEASVDGSAAAHDESETTSEAAKTEQGNAPVANSTASPTTSPLRYPQRRIMNRCGTPPLRLACSQALATSGAVS